MQLAELLSQQLGLLFVFGFFFCHGQPLLLNHFQITRCRGNGQLLRYQIVSAIAIGDYNHLAAFSELKDVIDENDFHSYLFRGPYGG